MPLFACTPPTSVSDEAQFGLVMRSGWPKAGGSFMLRSPPPGRMSSPMIQRTAGESLPMPSVRSMNSPKTSESDSLIAPDWY